jgi:hypothetical protein
MFKDLRNTGDDHLGASSGLIPKHSPLINLVGGDEGSQWWQERRRRKGWPLRK